MKKDLEVTRSIEELRAFFFAGRYLELGDSTLQNSTLYQ